MATCSSRNTEHGRTYTCGFSLKLDPLPSSPLPRQLIILNERSEIEDPLVKHPFVFNDV